MTNMHKGWSSKTKVMFAVAGLSLLFGRYIVSALVSNPRRKNALKKFKPEQKRLITCNSGNSWYAELDGPPDAQTIVFIHGLQSSGLQWYHQQKQFRSSYRLLLLDLPGHGRSPKAAQFSIPVLTADLAEVLSVLFVHNPILYGHSIGGMILLDYSIKHKDKPIRGLVVHNCSYTNPLKSCLFPLLMRSIEMPLVRPFMELAKRQSIIFSLLGRLNYYAGLSIAFYRMLLFSGAQTAAELRQLCHVAAVTPPEVVASGVLSTLDFDVSRNLHRIATQCLIIGSEDDRLIRPRAAYYIARHVQHGRAQILSGGHMNMVEYPGQINNALARFFSSLG
jgi:pimeloyl-ACP methyl ester carboxylesterase